DAGAQARQFESAEGEAHAVARFDDPGGVDLEPDHLEVGCDAAEASGHLDGGVGAGAVAEVYDEWAGGVERGYHGGFVRHPPIHAAQPVDVGGSAGHAADRPSPGTSPGEGGVHRFLLIQSLAYSASARNRSTRLM